MAQYDVDANRATYNEAKIMLKYVHGQDKTNIRAYKNFFKINQYPLDNELESVKPKQGNGFKEVIYCFLSLVFVYFIYDLITCLKEDKLKYQ